jgi:hypothetical protein
MMARQKAAAEAEESAPVLVKYTGTEERSLNDYDLGISSGLTSHSWVWSEHDLHMTYVPAEVADALIASGGNFKDQFVEASEDEVERYEAMMASRKSASSDQEYRQARAEAEAAGIPIAAYDSYIESKAIEENASEEPGEGAETPDPPTPSDAAPAEPGA